MAKQERLKAITITVPSARERDIREMAKRLRDEAKPAKPIKRKCKVTPKDEKKFRDHIKAAQKLARDFDKELARFYKLLADDRLSYGDRKWLDDQTVRLEQHMNVFNS